MTTALRHLPRLPSVLFPSQPADPRGVVPFAELVRSLAVPRLWMGQSLLAETMSTMAFLAGAGYTLPMGTSVSLMALRHPYDAALQARTVAIATGAPFVLGLGTATPGFVAGMRGEPWKSPVAAAREYLQIVRALLADEPVTHEGEYYRLHARLSPVDADRGDGGTPVEVGAGVLRPAMARMVGATADAAITWMTKSSYLEDTLVPALDIGAARADRPRPRVVTCLHVAVERPGRDAGALAAVAAGGHLQAPHYLDMLARSGISIDRDDDPMSRGRALVESGVFVSGTPQHIVDVIADHHAVGVDEVVLNPAGVLFGEGIPAALADLSAILLVAGRATGTMLPQRTQG